MDYNAVTTKSGRMWSTLPAAKLARYVAAQAAALFPDGGVLDGEALESCTARSFETIARGWRHIAVAGYTREGEAAFSHLHGDRYAAFLGLLARELFLSGAVDLATRVYLLNKALHGLDLFYEVEMPEVFVLVHPVGTVIGRAKLGNFLCVYQNCAIGGSPRDGAIAYPTLGDGVLMYAKSSIIGACTIGDGVVLGAGVAIINKSVPAGTLLGGTKTSQEASLHLARIFVGFAK